MEIIADKRVDKFINSMSDVDRGRVSGYLELFRKNGFALPGKYLKKIAGNLWELRPGNVRLLIGKAGNQMILVHIFIKKSQKTPQKEIKTAINRLKEYFYE